MSNIEAAAHVKAWQCIGCGMIEAPQTCIGVCEHRRVEFVYAAEHEQAVAAARARIDALEQLLRRLVATRSRDGQHHANLEHFRQAAQALLQS